MEAVVALFIIAASAAAWVQMMTAAARSEVAVDRRRDAVELAAAELEVLRVTPGIETGTDSSGGTSSFDGRTVLVDDDGPSHSETIRVDGQDFDVERYVLDPGSDSWRHLVVVVTWADATATRDVRVDTAIPLLGP